MIAKIWTSRSSRLRRRWIMRNSEPLLWIGGILIAASSAIVLKELNTEAQEYALVGSAPSTTGAAALATVATTTVVDPSHSSPSLDFADNSRFAPLSEMSDAERAFIAELPPTDPAIELPSSSGPPTGFTSIFLPDGTLDALANAALPAPVLLPAKAAKPVTPELPGLSNTKLRFFNGRPVRASRSIRMLVTAYSPDERSCPGTADNITASLHHVATNDFRSVAADTRLLPLGSMLTIDGYDSGRIVPVLDRGGAIKGNRLDVLFPTHEQALKWGKRWINVTVWEYADGDARCDWRAYRDNRK